LRPHAELTNGFEALPNQPGSGSCQRSNDGDVEYGKILANVSRTAFVAVHEGLRGVFESKVRLRRRDAGDIGRHRCHRWNGEGSIACRRRDCSITIGPKKCIRGIAIVAVSIINTIVITNATIAITITNTDTTITAVDRHVGLLLGRDLADQP